MLKVLYIEDVDYVARGYIFFMEFKYVVVRPAGEGQELAEKAISLLKDGEHYFHYVVQDVHLSSNDPDELYYPGLHQAILDYRKTVNPNLVWFVMSGSGSADVVSQVKKNYKEADKFLDKLRTDPEDLVDYIQEYESRFTP